MTRVKFAVVREDPALEAELIRRTGAGAALVVASGGCTALSLAAEFPGVHVAAFDRSQAQLDHAQAKLDRTLASDHLALNVASEDPEGLNQRGEFEGLFRQLRSFLREFVATDAEIAAALSTRTPPAERRAIVEGWFASRYWSSAFACSFTNELLVAMFGPDAVRHAVPGSYPGYFRAAFERGLRRDDAPRNPFLWHVLRGTYGEEALPAYLSLASRPAIEWICGSIEEVPEISRFGVVSLSNIFDWSDDDLVARWASVLAALAPGSAILVRVLNNQRDVRPAFSRDFSFDDGLGAALLDRDRSLFYEKILVGLRR
jgi:S-adenosylmethionine-diacylglycerol 3-amino-3-carboxypropyl transferase